MNDVRIGQGREAAKQYLKDNPDIARTLEAGIREDIIKAIADSLPMSNMDQIAQDGDG